MADGAGDPGAAQYRATVQALYGIAYAIRFALKNDDAMEYPVMPLQGRWWAAGEREVDAVDRSLWLWTMMILQPPQATEALVARATARVRRTRPAAAVDGVRLARLAEGRCAQVLHTGPYRAENPTIERLRAFVQAQGCVWPAGTTRSTCPTLPVPPRRSSRRSSATPWPQPEPDPERRPAGHGQNFRPPAWRRQRVSCSTRACGPDAAPLAVVLVGWRHHRPWRCHRRRLPRRTWRAQIPTKEDATANRLWQRTLPSTRAEGDCCRDPALRRGAGPHAGHHAHRCPPARGGSRPGRRGRLLVARTR
jgi:hypothetical protein